MSSGITPTDECEIHYNALKMNKVYRYILFTITGSKIDVMKKAKRDSSFQDFIDDLIQLKDSGCYAVIDYEGEGVKGSNLIFVSWVPDKATTRMKMLYASSREHLKARFQGLKGDLQADDISEVTESALASKAKEKSISY
ncbi:Cofilin [Schistosoma japonicum]|uniref:Actin depolymerizing factor-like protein n=1 Tax=Schistosoma japonicum TaxID=6182 RepID=Q86ES4_SCHJA|nr:SJCHGC01677 protein [Schistosoma japonicum]KAH8867649.1 Cofilin [Schistosoma japonicum]TNN05865.1 Cofilin [Schistosoma japonicum]CAX72056.1 actin depolymerizing factor-like protein [Schistosoma japonicum]CAX72057.1 actin depolymerizing factor-like protein [Schistosoma japonicum]